MRVLALLVLLTIFSTASAACDDGYSGLNCDILNKTPGSEMGDPHKALYNSFAGHGYTTSNGCLLAGQDGTLPPNGKMYRCLHDTLPAYQKQYMTNVIEYSYEACTSSPAAFLLPAAFSYLQQKKVDLVTNAQNADLQNFLTCHNTCTAQTAETPCSDNGCQWYGLFCSPVCTPPPIVDGSYIEGAYDDYMKATTEDPSVCIQAIADQAAVLAQAHAHAQAVAAAKAAGRRRI